MNRDLVFDDALDAALHGLGCIASQAAGRDATFLHGVMLVPEGHREGTITLGANQDVDLFQTRFWIWSIASRKLPTASFTRWPGIS